MLFCFSHHLQVFIIYMVWLNTLMAQSHTIHLPLCMCPCCSWQLPFGRQLREDCMEEEFIAPSSHPRPVSAVPVLSSLPLLEYNASKGKQHTVLCGPASCSPSTHLAAKLVLVPAANDLHAQSHFFDVSYARAGRRRGHVEPHDSEPEVGVKAAQILGLFNNGKNDTILSSSIFSVARIPQILARCVEFFKLHL